MDPLTWMLIGSAVGAGTGILGYGQKKEDAANQRRMNAAAMYYSPWTGMKPNQLYTPDPSLLGEATSGALLGASFGGILGKKFGDTTSDTTLNTDTGTDTSSVAGGGKTTKAAQAQIPTDDKPSLYDRSLQSSYARGQGGPMHSPWMYMPSAPSQAIGPSGAILPPYQATPPLIRY